MVENAIKNTLKGGVKAYGEIKNYLHDLMSTESMPQKTQYLNNNSPYLKWENRQEYTGPFANMLKNGSAKYIEEKNREYDRKKNSKWRGLPTGLATGIISDDPQRVYTTEDVAEFGYSGGFGNHEGPIMNQLTSIGIPTNDEAKNAVNSGQMVWVPAHQRRNGAMVRGYYRRP